jgi:peptide/nickel transport system permease protein
MLKALAYRLLSLIPLLFVISSITFFIIHFIPGDPVDLMLGDYSTDDEREALRQSLGLSGSLWQQYLNFLSNLVRFDLGTSIFSNSSVTHLILERMPATLELTSFSILLSCLWGIPLGVITSSTKSTSLDFGGTSLGVLGMSIPGYFLGPLLIYIFSVYLGLLPVGGRDGFANLILPSLSLALPLGAILMRMTRAAMQEVLTQDYIRVAYSKGITKKEVYFKHALKNALMPIITVVGLQIGTLLTGTVITETIFSWPGLGTLLFDAINQRDYPIVQGCIIVIACIYVLVNFLTDALYTVANPKVSHT